MGPMASRVFKTMRSRVPCKTSERESFTLSPVCCLEEGTLGPVGCQEGVTHANRQPKEGAAYYLATGYDADCGTQRFGLKCVLDIRKCAQTAVSPAHGRHALTISIYRCDFFTTRRGENRNEHDHNAIFQAVCKEDAAGGDGAGGVVCGIV